MQRITLTQLPGQLLLLPVKTKQNKTKQKGNKLTSIEEEHIEKTKYLLYKCNQTQVCTRNINSTDWKNT